MDLQEHADPFAGDILFIFEECKRFMDMGFEGLKTLPKEELWYHLPHPSGQGGMMMCGPEAAKRVDKLVAEAGRRAGLSRRVTDDTLRRPTEKLLVQRFLIERRELNRSQIDRFLATAGRKARDACRDTTHFIPCTLMNTKDPETLTLGPVVFHNRTSFRRKFLKHVRGYGAEQKVEGRRKYVRRLMAQASWFYRQFDWVAEVEVRGCDDKTSAKVAERAVTSALDCLQLLLRVRYTNKMRVGGPAIRTDRRAGVTIDGQGKMHPHFSTSWAGQGNFRDGWSKSHLDDPGFAHMVTLLGLALEAAVDPDLLRPISRRFLDAAQWFGEASRDDRAATRVVKYVTALERMVMTNEMDDIAKLVSERVAALCCDRTNHASDRQNGAMKLLPLMICVLVWCTALCHHLIRK